jgi:transcriptional regulator with XRE-family HTH domain
MAKPTPLAKRILELRKQLGMTQQELALKVSVSKGAISHFEKGLSKPSSDTLGKLSEVLGEDLKKQLLHIGRFPVLSVDDNEPVAIIQGNQYDRLKWDYLRRNEAELPDEEEEAQYALSGTSYAYKALSLPTEFLGEGKHIAYPMSGDQMAPLFERGDLLIFTLLDKSKWTDMDESSDFHDEIDNFSIYAVEVRTPSVRSLHIGRFSISQNKKILRCYYDDRTVPYSIALETVVAVWKYKWVLSARSKNIVQPLLNRIRELEYALNKRVDKQSAKENAHYADSEGYTENGGRANSFFTYHERIAELLEENPDIIGVHRSDEPAVVQLIIDLARDNELEELYARENNGIKDFKIYYALMEEEIHRTADLIIAKARAQQRAA